MSNPFANVELKPQRKSIGRKVTKTTSSFHSSMVEKVVSLSKSTSNNLSDIVDQHNLKKKNSAVGVMK